MTDVVITGWIVTAAGAFVLFLLGVLWAWVRDRFSKAEAELVAARAARDRDMADEREARERDIKAEREARERECDDLKKLVATTAASQQRLELEVSKEYASKKMLEQMEERISGDLRKIDETLRALFAELKQKQDKS